MAYPGYAKTIGHFQDIIPNFEIPNKEIPTFSPFVVFFFSILGFSEFYLIF